MRSKYMFFDKAFSITEEHENQLKEIFNMFVTKEHPGKIRVQELQFALSSMGKQPNKEYIEAAINERNKNNNNNNNNEDPVKLNISHSDFLYETKKEYSFVVNISRTTKILTKRVATMLASNLIKKPKTVIGISVGATTANCYRNITKFRQNHLINLEETKFILFDEFFANENGKSLPKAPHLKELKETFFDKAQIPEINILHPDTNLSFEDSLEAYKEIVKENKPDILVLGVGPGGVLGWNLGSTENNIKEKGIHSIDITDFTFQQNKGYNKCISMGLKTIMEAKEVYLLAVAYNKAEVVKDIIEDTENKTPASYILHNHPNVVLFIDNRAAGLLTNSNSSQNQDSINGFLLITESNVDDYFTNKTIICFSPHPDDTAISAGATLSFLSKNNRTISCVCTTGHRAYISNTTANERVSIREKEATNEAKQINSDADFLRLPLYDLGKMSETDINIVKEYIEKNNPDCIFLPHTGDSHPTHQEVCKTILVAIQRILIERNDQLPLCSLFMYEGPWSLFPRGSYNCIFSPSELDFKKKLLAIREHVSQTARTPYDVASDALSLLRGSLVPEQDLSGFGEKPPEMQPKVELFYHIEVNNPNQILKLLTLHEKHLPPKAHTE
eukprot:TRINITY_DN1538_c2_g1_i1.p1 TRINITY_DN1538_c2_g1~~TRINITY_DN1538_c2_g1_i1.p1  ORF type:complete len:680 (-),score=215.97 TRINITY_DN1538_c2_g1_i1:144-1997(-)